LPLWDTTQQHFLRFWIQLRRFPLLWDTTKEVFCCCRIQRTTISRWLTIFFSRCIPQGRSFSSLVGYNGSGFFSLYHTMQKFFFRCILHHNRIVCVVLYLTTQKIFLHFIPQCRRFSSVVRIPQWKRFSSVVGYNGRGFFHCGIQWRKIIQCRIIFLNFKCLSLPSNKKLGKISYLNS
jgi:preprotein translocase subunit Sss1